MLYDLEIKIEMINILWEYDFVMLKIFISKVSLVEF